MYPCRMYESSAGLSVLHRGVDSNQIFSSLTANQFLAVWNHYDSDGTELNNGTVKKHFYKMCRRYQQMLTVKVAEQNTLNSVKLSYFCTFDAIPYFCRMKKIGRQD